MVVLVRHHLGWIEALLVEEDDVPAPRLDDLTRREVGADSVNNCELSAVEVGVQIPVLKGIDDRTAARHLADAHHELPTNVRAKKKRTAL